jgi:hypothetical protein
LGRGLSALLGESFDLNRPVGAPQPGAPAAPAQPAADVAQDSSNVASFPPPWMAEMANETDGPAAAPPPPVQRLEPASAPAASTQQSGAHLAPIEFIQRNPNQPRQTFDEKEL